MELTSKTDRLIEALMACSIILDASSVCLSEITTGNKAMHLISAIKGALNKLRNIGISKKDVRNEYWKCCPHAGELPKYIAIIGTRFDQAEISANFEDYLFGGTINCTVWDLQKKNVITKTEASDISCYMDILASDLSMWVNDIKDIITEFRNIVANADREMCKKQQVGNLGNENQHAERLPKELDTDKAKAVLNKAIESGLCDNKYIWKETIQLLAYFADKTSHYLNLTTKTDKDGNIYTSWQPFEALFQYDGKENGKAKLKGAKQNWMRLNTRFEPTGYSRIDSIFE